MSRPDRKKQLWLLPGEGQARHQPVAEIAPLLPNRRSYTYTIPPELDSRVRPGVRVEVPYGHARRTVVGWCLARTEAAWDATRKPIRTVLDETPWVTPALIELARWVSSYYACPPGFTLEALVPATLRNHRPRRVRHVRRVAETLPEGLTPRQRELAQALPADLTPWRAIHEATGIGDGVLKALQAAGVAEVAAHPLEENVVSGVPPHAPEDDLVLTADQQRALDAVLADHAAGRFRVHLLFGVPGSGKTEVYVRAIRRALQAGQQAILLVPEIALVTQIVERLVRRFPRVAVLHSRLPATRRARALRQIERGEADVVIGTRTAVFAPCRRLGLIVVDEEQETSFKSLAAPFYHARDVAIKRAQLESVPVVLGSATPALETWRNANELGHYQMVELPQRVPGADLPRVEIVTHDDRQPGVGLLSERLVEELRATAQAGQQAILLHNRRGSGVHLRCRDCGLRVLCQRCDAPLVEHRFDGTLKCHQCGRVQPLRTTCLDQTCGGELVRAGEGIQQLEEVLGKVVPRMRLLRLDRDTMRRRDDYLESLETFAARKADLLIGTQMIAKGLDFPHVRLVGVIGADQATWIPDLRAGEQAFQLFVQVVGRAGRGRDPGLALLQTAEPDLPVLHEAVRMDYRAFAERELLARRRLGYPPFTRLVRLICSDPQPRKARLAAETLRADLLERAGRIDARLKISEPQPCVVARRRQMSRYEIRVFAPHAAARQQLLQVAEDERKLLVKCERLTVDVDPLELM